MSPPSFEKERQYVASPLFHFLPGQRIRGINLLTREVFSEISKSIIDVFYFFLTPRKPLDAPSRLLPEAIAISIEIGAIMAADDPAYIRALLWEQHEWSLPANLLLSQMDLDYEDRNISSVAQAAACRRSRLETYIEEEPYPTLMEVPVQTIISLPMPDLAWFTPSLEKMRKRRSIRKFQSDDISLMSLAGTLRYSTQYIRIREESQRNSDIFFLLNSFYTWLHVFVVVQGVAGLDRGVYRYDPLKHTLEMLSNKLDDDYLISTVQGQEWILGAGFCVYVVSQWDRYMWLYRHSRAYVNLLIQVGEFGQEVFQAASHFELSGWGTPAVHESRAAKLLTLNASLAECLYCIKLGQSAH